MHQGLVNCFSLPSNFSVLFSCIADRRECGFSLVCSSTVVLQTANTAWRKTNNTNVLVLDWKIPASTNSDNRGCKKCNFHPDLICANLSVIQIPIVEVLPAGGASPLPLLDLKGLKLMRDLPQEHKIPPFFLGCWRT